MNTSVPPTILSAPIAQSTFLQRWRSRAQSGLLLGAALLLWAGPADARDNDKKKGKERGGQQQRGRGGQRPNFQRPPQARAQQRPQFNQGRRSTLR